MNQSQKDRIAPYWDAIKLAHQTGQWIGGSDALQVMNKVNMELGNLPSCLTCSAGVFDLIKMTYNNYTK